MKDTLFDNINLYPTPVEVIERMVGTTDITGKVILEPSAGTGNIINWLNEHGAQDVLACETHPLLRDMLTGKCKLIEDDFMKVTSDQISHIHAIIMNPPFMADEKHILHAWEIAPSGCEIIALCNLNTLKNSYYSSNRKELKELVDSYGNYEDFGTPFKKGERYSGVEIACVRLFKHIQGENEFEGFYLDEEPEEPQFNAIMPYNFIRDLVQRYIGAVKIFDRQLEEADKMNRLTSSFFSGKHSLSFSKDKQPVIRAEFKKDLQKDAWMYIFKKMDMQKHTTRGLKEDINKFVEKQHAVPFTMKNIYRMLEIVVGTTEQRMDKALIEVFDKLTKHYDDNRFYVEGWKTNSHYLVNKKFIFPYCVEQEWNKRTVKIKTWNGNGELISDVEKALCYLSGDNYGDIKDKDGKVINPGIVTVQDIGSMNLNQWYFSHFFKCKGFLKGTLHCEFVSEELWGKFNQRIAKLKGYPLFEHTKDRPAAVRPEKDKMSY